jgi:hypothetical protein
MRSLGGSIIFLVVMLLVDIYVFQALRAVSPNWHSRTRLIVFVSYWLICAVGLAFFASLPYIQLEQVPKALRTYLLATSIGWFLAQLIAIPFFLIDDLRRLAQWIIAQFVARTAEVAQADGTDAGISRSVFLSWLGLGIGSSLFGSLLYGFRNKYNYQVNRISLPFAQLPPSFKGLKVVHISDIHSGSFMNTKAVEKGVEIINNLHPDVILFTGDLVNDRADEMEPYIGVFNKLRARLGVYSTFGNHDYGDYARWPSEEAKKANLEKLRQVHAQLGWRLLNDETVKLEQDGAQIGLIGVQNISGKGRFHSYGNLEKAYADSADLPFKMLMSHDPSHWDAEVRTRFPDIALTLSGHTHGMQFGVELPGFKWSPVQWMYKQWAGLYEEGAQKLYVNRGFGFIGYPGRVGILPEITLIELV